MDEWEEEKRTEILDRFYVFYNMGFWFHLGYVSFILDIFFRSETPHSSIFCLFTVILLPFLAFIIYETYLYLKKGDRMTYQERKYIKFSWFWLLLGLASIASDFYKIYR